MQVSGLGFLPKQIKNPISVASSDCRQGDSASSQGRAPLPGSCDCHCEGRRPVAIPPFPQETASLPSP